MINDFGSVVGGVINGNNEGDDDNGVDIALKVKGGVNISLFYLFFLFKNCFL